MGGGRDGKTMSQANGLRRSQGGAGPPPADCTQTGSNACPVHVSAGGQRTPQELHLAVSRFTKLCALKFAFAFLTCSTALAPEHRHSSDLSARLNLVPLSISKNLLKPEAATS